MSRRARVPGLRKNVLFVLPAIPDDATDELKNSLAIRNQCSVELLCPACGAVPELHLDQYGIHHLVFRHESWCGALTDAAA